MKARVNRTRINKVGKYPYNKNKNYIINFENPSADHLTKKFFIKSSRGNIGVNELGKLELSSAVKN